MAFFLLSSLVLARDYYVAPYGNDSNSGESKEQPWATLPHACENVAASAQDPAVIHLAPHEYGDGPYYAHGGMWYDCLSLPSYVSLMGCSPRVTVLNYWIDVNPGSTLIEGVTVVTIEFSGDLAADSSLTVRNCVAGGCIPGYQVGAIETDVQASQEARDVTLGLVIDHCVFESCFFFGNFDPIIQVNVNCEGCRLSLQIRDTSFGFEPIRRQTSLRVRLDTGDGVAPTDADEIVIANTRVESLRDDSQFLRIYSSGAAQRNIVVQNALIIPSVLSGQGTFLSVQSFGSEIALSMSNSTALGGASFATDAALPGLTKLSAVDSIIHDSMIALDGRPPTISAVNSCVSWPIDGEGVIHSDPLFAAGALGEHYLSHIDSGQPETSPCVDAGSILASESTVAGLTTRTDHEPDTGRVDMGFHYGRRIGPKPYIELGHDNALVCPGNDLTAYVLLKCDGTIMLADVYLAGAYGDQLFYLSDDGWTRSQMPWMRKAPIRDYLPDYFSFPIHFPENIPTGTYTIYLGLIDHYSGELVSLASTPVEVAPK
ncbi:MAG: hypothetical protein JW759_04020 [Candidatus Coatesbacteria bacterium]|nr:hypothetical protein [Candidatus Coatesbacteria bacterium]